MTLPVLRGPFPCPTLSVLDLDLIKHVPETFGHERQFGRMATSQSQVCSVLIDKLIHAHS